MIDMLGSSAARNLHIMSLFSREVESSMASSEAPANGEFLESIKDCAISCLSSLNEAKEARSWRLEVEGVIEFLRGETRCKSALFFSSKIPETVKTKADPIAIFVALTPRTCESL